eukprot:GHVN01058582.1.p1 GENE.GHVN01058582.1~~GHVN01058582.1.p1  ORF type:complete len:245 (+),score=40.37 GHVN01058582.1:875-1609(+)
MSFFPHLQVEQYHEVVKHVSVKQYVDKHVEHITYVPVIEVKSVEKEVQIPPRDGRVIEVPKPYTVEEREYVPVFKDNVVPCIVSQKLVPLIEQSGEEIEVEARKYVPYLVPIDVYVPRPVEVPLIPLNHRLPSEHIPVQVSAAQYNTLLYNINPQLRGEMLEEYLPTMRALDGTVPLMDGSIRGWMGPSLALPYPQHQHPHQHHLPAHHHHQQQIVHHPHPPQYAQQARAQPYANCKLVAQVDG